MERIKALGRYQKGALLISILIALVFTVIYPVTIAREGFLYKDVILTPTEENGNTVYSGKIQGKKASFTVDEDKTVVFQYGDQTYGPYRFKEDPTAIPQDMDFSDHLLGLEVWQGDQMVFRGCVEDQGDIRWIYNEGGILQDISILATSGDIVMDENGNVTDTIEPPVTVILNLMSGPNLTHKGDWSVWFLGIFICIFTVVSILFADELFRWNLSFQIRNVDRAEPSDWEMTRRYITWTVLPIFAIIAFMLGLQ